MQGFFDVVRGKFGPLSQSQVDGFELLVKACAQLPQRHAAYVLATAFHETARTMQPIYERGNRDYFNKYEPGTKIGKDLGNTIKGDGYKFRGRGYVQITGRANYVKAARECGVDMVAAPDLALDPVHAVKIIVAGMRDGWFTGKRMSNFETFKAMRRVVNGTDKDELIADYAETFLKALQAVKTAPVAPSAPAPTPDAPKVDLPASDAPRGLLAAFIAILAAIFKRK